MRTGAMVYREVRSPRKNIQQDVLGRGERKGNRRTPGETKGIREPEERKGTGERKEEEAEEEVPGDKRLILGGSALYQHK